MVDRAIIRPTAWGDKNQNHKEKYLESMLLFLTQECKPFFKSLIKCEYLIEANFIEQVECQKRTLQIAQANDAKQSTQRGKGAKKGVEKYLPDQASRDKNGNLIKAAKVQNSRKQDPEQLFAEANHQAVRQFNFRDHPPVMQSTIRLGKKNPGDPNEKNPPDYLHFINTYKYFLDQLLVEFS